MNIGLQVLDEDFTLILCILIKDNETPLQIAERGGHDHVVSYLLRKCFQDDVSSDSGSRLDVSTESGESIFSLPGGA